MRVVCLLVAYSLWVVDASAFADEPLPVPGMAVDYAPLAFFPKRWQEQKHSTQLVTWEGKQVVLLTPKKDLDPEVMAIFLERLDGGWKYYADMLGQSPRPAKLLNKKVTIAAVPDVRLTCGLGCGQVGATGIEIGGFDNDYVRITKNQKLFPHYYFYEMGRNYFVFGDRHSSFTTGFAVFMRYCCMDKLKCEDDEAALRKQIEQAEEHYSKTDLTFLQAFTMQGGLGEKAPRLKDVPGPSDQPVLYASAMLKLHRDYGGDEWVGRFFHQLATCPEVKPDKPEGALRQSLAWYVCASLAAKQDLAPVFVERWRLLLGAETRQALKGIQWENNELTAANVLKMLPDDPSK
jgi:hypothetical protein